MLTVLPAVRVLLVMWPVVMLLVLGVLRQTVDAEGLRVDVPVVRDDGQDGLYIAIRMVVAVDRPDQMARPVQSGVDCA